MGFMGLTTDHCAHWSQSHILHWQVSAGANTMRYLKVWRTVKGIAWVFAEAAFTLTPTGSHGQRRSHRPADQGLPKSKRHSETHFGSLRHKICALFHRLPLIKGGPQKASRLNLHLLPSKTPQRIYQSIIVCSRPRTNRSELRLQKNTWVVSSKSGQRSLIFLAAFGGAFEKRKPCGAVMMW